MNKLFIFVSALLIFCSCGDGGTVLSGEDTQVSTSLSVGPNPLNIGTGSGPSFVKVNSNTNWTVYVNNSGSSISGLDVSPLSGSGDGSLRVSYNSINTQHWGMQTATINVSYYSMGYKQSKSVSVVRKGNP